MMKFSTLTLLGLLCCCLSARCMRQEITDPTLPSLKTEVRNALVTLVKNDLTAANDTINAHGDAISACQVKIEEQQNKCVQCVNTTCQRRVDDLGCTSVLPTPQATGCKSKALCDIAKVVQTSVAGVIVIGDAIGKIGKQAIEAIKKVSEQVINTVGSGLEDAGKAIAGVANKIATGVAGTANKIASEIEGAAKKVGTAIAKGVNDAIKETEKVINQIGDGIKDGVNAIGNVLGGRKRRQAMEPDCDQFGKDELACLYYQDSCNSCKPLDSTDTQTVITNVCGQADANKFQATQAAADRIDPVIELYNNFTLVGVNIDPLSWAGAGFTDVVVTYGMVIGDKAFQLSKTVNIWLPSVTAPDIAQEVFDRELL